jgi:hypothetical protein
MTIEDKKKALEKEINALKEELDESINTVSQEVEHSFEPKKLIQKYPLKALGISVVAGFLLAYKAGSKKTSSPLMDSIKKELSSRAITLIFEGLSNNSSKKD